MKRVAFFTAVVLTIIAVAFAGGRGGAVAQSSDSSAEATIAAYATKASKLEDKLDAFRTSIAKRDVKIDELSTRVAELEVYAPKSGNELTFSGIGVQVTEPFTLETGRYKVSVTVEALNFDGFQLFLYPPVGDEDTVFNELIEVPGTWTASTIYISDRGGDFYAATGNTSSNWTVTFEKI